MSTFSIVAEPGVPSPDIATPRHNQGMKMADELRSDGIKNAWMPLISMACLMIAVWIGLPCLFFGALGCLGLVEDFDGLVFLLGGIFSLVPGVVLLLIAIRLRKPPRSSA
jgi:hypothetical protein